MAQILYRVCVKVEYANGFEKWLKYRNVHRDQRFIDFLNRSWPDWRYFNLYETTRPQAYVGRVYNRNHPADIRNRVGLAGIPKLNQR